MKRRDVAAGIALVVAIAGCAGPDTRLSTRVSSGKTPTEATRIQTDEADCGAYADPRPDDIRYASYVGCLISRGYRTYVSLTRYGSVTGLTVYTEASKNAEQVFRDLRGCATAEDTKIDVPAPAGLYMGIPVMIPARPSYQAPFANCLARLGYTTLDGDQPLAVAGRALVEAPAPPASASAPPTRTVVVPPPAPPTQAAPPVVMQPPPRTPSSTVAVAPPPTPAAPATPPAARPTASAVTRDPGRKPIGVPGAVALGLNVDRYSSPPVVIVVISKTPAAEAGVRPGDVVLAVDETPVASLRDITNVLSAKYAGDVLRLQVQRGQQRLTLETTVPAR